MSAAITRPVAGTSRTARPRSVAAQVKAQRRGYAQAVLASLARSLKGQPIAVVQRALKNALGPLGVRPAPAGLQLLAAAITGQPGRHRSLMTVPRSIIGLPAKIASVGHLGQQCAGIHFSGSVTLIA